MEVKDESGAHQGRGRRHLSRPARLQPARLARSREAGGPQLTAGDVIKAIQEQNVQVAAGRLGQPPVPAGRNCLISLRSTPKAVWSTRISSAISSSRPGERGQNVFLRDVVRDAKYDKDGDATDKGIELGAKNYDVNSYLDGKPGRDAGRLSVARLERPENGRSDQGQDARTQAAVPRRGRLWHLLRHDRLRRRVDPRGLSRR